MITKEVCRDYALKVKEETGKFPSASNWIVANGYPCGFHSIRKLFGGSYNNFRDYCGEPHKVRTISISLEWIKNNCVIDENQCWNWSKACYSDGYGKVGVNYKVYAVHRLSFQLSNSEIPDHLIVRHKCDNKKCCNPEHLELGTQSDNILDSVSRLGKKEFNTSNINVLTRKLKSLEEKIEYYLLNTYRDNDRNCLIPIELKPLSGDYYRIELLNKSYLLHRLILAHKINKQYDEVNIARHICHNKKCINPEHLIEGNLSDNTLNSREYSKLVKLTKDKVIEIKQAMRNTNFLIKGSKKAFDMYWSNKFNVGIGTISSIRLNKSWKDV